MNVRLSVTTDLALGGRWTSLRAGEREWLWRNPEVSLAQRARARPGMPFVDAGGGEECFPSVTGDPALGHDHGDIWCRPWVGEPADASVATRHGLTLRRRLIERGPVLRVEYEITAPSTSYLRREFVPSEVRTHADGTKSRAGAGGGEAGGPGRAGDGDAGDVGGPGRTGGGDAGDVGGLGRAAAEAGVAFVHAVHLLLDVSPGATVRVPGTPAVAVQDHPRPGEVARGTWPEAAGARLDLLGPDDGTAICVVVASDAVEIRDGEDRLSLRWGAEPGVPTSFMLWRNLRGWPAQAPYRSIGIEPMIGATPALAGAAPEDTAVLDPTGSVRWWLEVSAAREFAD